MKVRKYYVVGPRQLTLQEEEVGEPGPGQVLIRTRMSALSVGTEVWRYLNGGHYGGEGSACGYNSAGEVVAVGPGVTHLSPGDLTFAPEPHADFLLVDAGRAIRLPPGLDLEAAVFSYLPTLGLHALRLGGYQAGGNVLVVGQGVVGVLAAMVARMVGARLVALEPDTARRRLAAQAGGHLVLDPGESSSDEQVSRVFGALGPDVIVETSQAWSGLAAAIRLARQETRIAIVGIYRSDPSAEVGHDLLRATFMNRDRFHNQHVRFIGCSNDPADDYPVGVARWTVQRNMQYIAEQIAAGLLAPARAITHRFRWDQLEDVYERFANGDRTMVGVVLSWD
jgi:2-desacetyl-2-hydroxyethyl bacteriochlorophyllide A dehydrogenase